MQYLYLAHHGIKGQKWGVRRYQNPDGTLTEEGRKHYQAIAADPITSVSKPTNRFDIPGQLKYRKQKKAAARYRDALSKLIDDDKIDLGENDEIIRSEAKARGISLRDAKIAADNAMEEYHKAEKSDVIKKYPHDWDTVGHPIEAGGYWNQSLMEDIEQKSGSWYWGEGKTQRFKRAYSQYRKIKWGNDPNLTWTQRQEKARNVLLDAVLKDLGFEVTQANRDAIEPHVFWD